ncbi:MAG: dTDP-4-dehydrorhamnose reductase family protein [Gammaproteobacteria bacterium]
MRILIVGGSGMLGHELLRQWQNKYTVAVTLRRSLADYHAFNLFGPENSYSAIDVSHLESLKRVFEDFKPSHVVNAVGVVKQRDTAKDAIPSIQINALFPHQLSQLCQQHQARLFHMSTDCVFSGKKGHYSEADFPDGVGLYAQSKLLGELHEAHCVTLRTSIIGYELENKRSLIEWFLAQKGIIKGFTQAIYTGFTTIEMARILEKIMVEHPHLSGLWHVASSAINKYELLTLFKNALNRDIIIQPDGSFVCDRSLDGKLFNKKISYKPPSWHDMLTELADLK